MCACKDNFPSKAQRKAEDEYKRLSKQHSKMDTSDDMSEYEKDSINIDIAEDEVKTPDTIDESEDLEGQEMSNRISPVKTEYTSRGFKTDAHHRFHAIHKNVIPDLRDAAKEGRKHNFFGFNAHVFRG